MLDLAIWVYAGLALAIFGSLAMVIGPGPRFPGGLGLGLGRSAGSELPLGPSGMPWRLVTSGESGSWV